MLFNIVMSICLCFCLPLFWRGYKEATTVVKWTPAQWPGFPPISSIVPRASQKKKLGAQITNSGPCIPVPTWSGTALFRSLYNRRHPFHRSSRIVLIEYNYGSFAAIGRWWQKFMTCRMVSHRFISNSLVLSKLLDYWQRFAVGTLRFSEKSTQGVVLGSNESNEAKNDELLDPMNGMEQAGESMNCLSDDSYGCFFGMSRFSDCVTAVFSLSINFPSKASKIEVMVKLNRHLSFGSLWQSPGIHSGTNSRY